MIKRHIVLHLFMKLLRDVRIAQDVPHLIALFFERFAFLRNIFDLLLKVGYLVEYVSGK